MIEVVASALLIGLVVTLGVALCLDSCCSSAFGRAWLWAEWAPAGIAGLVTAAVVLASGNQGESASEIWESFRKHWNEIDWWW
ncbi:MAG TPA: hypothetical protein VHZ99_07620 [Steroidobacteraceae bacterium]|nr:hypothetical protein [Steroidobacteraceae bacterium]